MSGAECCCGVVSAVDDCLLSLTDVVVVVVFAVGVLVATVGAVLIATVGASRDGDDVSGSSSGDDDDALVVGVVFTGTVAISGIDTGLSFVVGAAAGVVGLAVTTAGVVKSALPIISGCGHAVELENPRNLIKYKTIKNNKTIINTKTKTLCIFLRVIVSTYFIEKKIKCNLVKTD